MRLFFLVLTVCLATTLLALYSQPLAIHSSIWVFSSFFHPRIVVRIGTAVLALHLIGAGLASWWLVTRLRPTQKAHHVIPYICVFTPLALSLLLSFLLGWEHPLLLDTYGRVLLFVLATLTAGLVWQKQKSSAPAF